MSKAVAAAVVGALVASAVFGQQVGGIDSTDRTRKAAALWSVPGPTGGYDVATDPSGADATGHLTNLELSRRRPVRR